MTKVADRKVVGGSDFLKGAAAGAASGAVGTLAGMGVKGVGGKIGKLMSMSTKAIKVVAGTVGGAAGGATGGVLGAFAKNILYRGVLKQKDFTKIIKEMEIDYEDGKALWTFLCDNGIIVDEVVQNPIPPALQFPENLQRHEKEVRQLIETCISLTKGLVSAAVEGSITGGIIGGVSAHAELKQQKKEKAQRRERARQTISARSYNHVDGSTKTPSSGSAKGEVCSAGQQRPADAHGEQPTHVRQRFIKENSHMLNSKMTRLDELEYGSADLGGEICGLGCAMMVPREVASDSEE